jgi:hypothetical protein
MVIATAMPREARLCATHRHKPLSEIDLQRFHCLFLNNLRVIGDHSDRTLRKQFVGCEFSL